MAPGLTQQEPGVDDFESDGSKLHHDNVKSCKHEEYQYLDLIRNILDNGEHRPDRSGTLLSC